MELPNPFKSQKLTITAISTPGKKEVWGKSFEVMFNPSQYTLSYRNRLKVHEGFYPAEATPTQVGQDPQYLTIKIILDGTGVADTSLLGAIGLGLFGKSVKERVKEFMDLCYGIQESKHSSNLLFIYWGIISFSGYLSSVSINYTLFDQSGDPLRAELDTEFLAVTTPVQLSSPDLTHIREVKAGDSLPLLAKEIYGSSRYYLLVAEANQLDDFRNLQPGMKLYFPPLEDQP